MPSDFSVHSSLPIPRPRSPRIFAPRTDVDVDDGIVPVDVGVVGHNHHHLQPYDGDEGGDLASKLGFARLRTSPAIVTLASAAKHHHFRSATDPLSDASPVDEEEEDSSEGYDNAASGISADMDMSLSPAAMFLSSFGAPPSLASSSPSSKTDAEEGDVVDGYTLGPVIGHGGFSVVRRATSPSSDLVAVKIVDRSSIPSSDVLTHRRLDNESAIWKTLSHEHILPLFHSFHSHTHSRRVDFFFMPLCPAGSLFDILKRDGQPDGLPHDDAGTMFRQVVRGVRYLHEQARLVHADLKLENVLVDASGSCRIADFGLACRIPDGGEGATVRRQRSLFAPHGHGHGQGPRVKPRAQSNYTTSTPSTHNTNSYTSISSSSVYALPAGSLPYAAPELLRSPTPDENYASYVPRPAQDVWALGVMLHGLLTGSLPFRDGFEPRLTMKILKGFDTMPPNIGRGAELVLRACLTSDPHKRWTIAAVDDIAWSVGWDSDDVEIERMIAEALGGGEEGGSGKSRSRSRQPAVIYEDEDEFPGGAVGPDARSSSSSSSVSTSSIASPSPFVRGRGRPSSHSLSRSRSRSPSPSISSIPPSTPTDAFLVPGPDDERRDRVLERGRKARARERSAERPAPYRRRSSQDGNSFSHSHLHSPSPDGALMFDSHSRSRSKAHTTHTRPFFERSISPRRAGSQPPPSAWAGLGRVRAGMMSKSSASVGLSPAQAVTPAPAPVTPRSGFVLGRVGVVGGKGRRSLSVDAEGRR